MSLLTELAAFYTEHRWNGDVEADRVWMTCTCGAAINRTVFAQGD